MIELKVTNEQYRMIHLALRSLIDELQESQELALMMLMMKD